MPVYKGRVWKFGDDIDTDVIIPARYLKTSDPEILKNHCMEDIYPEFAKQVKAGDILVGGRNFGCGSSREHAPISIKGTGAAAIIAKTFARIFYRNCFNMGLPIFESAEAAKAIEDGHEVSIDSETGEITDITTGAKYQAAPIPPFMQELIEAGGLMPYTKKLMAERSA